MQESTSRQVGRFLRLTCLIFWAILLATAEFAVAQAGRESWQLPVCADPDNLPYSSRREAGFENEIAQIIADELNADLEFIWLPLPRREGAEELMLRMGFCDVLLAVPDGTDPFLTTLAYYRSTAVFVLPQDADFEVESLDDPDLRQLRIGVRRGSPEDFALTQRGLLENVDHFHPSDPPAAILEAVARGAVDLGIVWGPIAGYHAQRLGLPLELEPVSPQFSEGFVSMVQATSLAVRANDRALQDLLNRAIARRWNDIHSVLRRWNVPIVPLPEPLLDDFAAVAPETRLSIGVVLPSLTGIDPLLPLGPELAAQPAWQGAVLAEERLGGGSTGPFELRLATAPTAEAAARAGRRLLLADDVSALIGGLGEGQAEVLGEVSDELGALFLNIGDSDQELRERCLPLSFHLEASDGMYLKGMGELLEGEGLSEPYVVHTDDERGAMLLDLFTDLSDTTISGHEPVPPDQPLFVPTFSRIEESGADSIVLLLPAGPQLVFLGQYETAGLAAPVIGFPAEVTQTRQFYAALAHDAPQTGVGPRLALWEATLQGEPEGLNETFLGRWGRPMDPTAWAGYAAVKLLVDAFDAAGTPDARTLADEIVTSEQELELSKDGPLEFNLGTRQLLQPLYGVRIDSGATTLEELAASVTAIAPEEAATSADCSSR